MKNKKIKFDPLAWVDKHDVNHVKSSEGKNEYIPINDWCREDELGKARAVCDELMLIGANIAESYDDYLRLGFSLADGLGSDGRDIFHALCSQSEKYRADECERKWQECLSTHNGSITIATYYKMAQDAGIKLTSIFKIYKYV